MFEKLTGVEQRLFDLLALGLVLFYAYSAVLEADQVRSIVNARAP